VGAGGEVLGGGGRGDRRWWGGGRHRRKWHSSAGRRGAEEVGARGWSGGRCGGVRGPAARGRSGG
jgi:hypothetical protein